MLRGGNGGEKITGISFASAFADPLSTGRTETERCKMQKCQSAKMKKTTLT